jgi:hypothetical protein
MKGEEVVGFPHYRVQGTAPSKSVVGSQPVSLDRENLELLRMKRCVLHCVSTFGIVAVGLGLG